MLQGWVVIAVALTYIGLLFLIASYGDRTRGLGREGRARLLIYPLSLAIYCTSWTFFGSVGFASRTGFDFLTIYIGPVLMIGLFSPLLMRVVRLAKTSEHYLDRRLHRCTLRQGPSGCSDSRVDCDRWHHSLHRIAAQSSLIIARNHPRPYPVGDRGHSSSARGHCAFRRTIDGNLRSAVWYSPYRCHRTSGWTDVGGRNGIDSQACCIPRRRDFRDLLDVRWPDSAVQRSDAAAIDGSHLQPGTTHRYSGCNDAALFRGVYPASEAVPRSRCRK